MEKRRLTPIVKVTHDCNLNCAYCYTHPCAERQISMNFGTLENMLFKITEYRN